MPTGRMFAVLALAASLFVINADGNLISRNAMAASGNAAISVEPQWLWGEVLAADAQNGTIRVKYLDYDTDMEKELVLNVDDKTKFQGASGLVDVKVQDTVSVDYKVLEGINLALEISVEKLEYIDDGSSDLFAEPAYQEKVGSAESLIEPVAEPGIPAQPAPSEIKEPAADTSAQE